MGSEQTRHFVGAHLLLELAQAGEHVLTRGRVEAGPGCKIHPYDISLRLLFSVHAQQGKAGLG